MTKSISEAFICSENFLQYKLAFQKPAIEANGSKKYANETSLYCQSAGVT